MSTGKLVLLFGATGETGFHVVNRLIQQGYKVRVVVRNKAKIL